ncbi:MULTISPECIES: bifunctional phosphoribosylaminoimidazolecarboxamide formyltransferase/IMP cyclohydrolase [Methanoculleus]|uniref:Phosphoribosylaminoimidazolecarboxamide formyltransferase / IMP cyclohydrolase n=2 Tax=Methanoculleus TaxID=45989 RepID=A3CUE6_METMJ|nr:MULTISPECIES: bifunctional phosphoribosylaminoimidazolecarboxamide formyltransferase/IMP cyclohydrolase [Methanoculleus]ABN56996.1 phosphoribosylaminoimidazolecarboxamide formyltransferase / IMP cyclohydrolase [Methanoculleus marisnigri JR1]MCC7556864.1 bifunctional phosphoribosylaminoimidazolecarboxamide formyltransferase/IMP cyclohydrolase [Methanoculleus marisnigri]UYU18416.1 bifunctional phosphoribosylaminoimidazolecarboxamide formyltransferase/IMP cyclohydrolase [Methanoculleus submarinu
MKWALLSVWDKAGIVDLAKVLIEHDYGILSSGGTGAELARAGISFTDVSAYTGFPEMMHGRVKTLHPKIHGGILGRRGIDDAVMQEHGIEPIDLVVVNLYPFEAMSGKGLSLEEIIEYIDIGGPAMVRAAAKNHKHVAVVADPGDYGMVADAVRRGGFSPEERLNLAAKAFARTAAYDAAITNHLTGIDRPFPDVFTVQFRNGRTLRYGENPHQAAAVYGDAGIAGEETLQGKEMSYNNYLDVHAAVGLLREFEECAVVIVKHNNPCGVATGESPLETYIAAREVDPVSAYGSIVAMNREVGADVARELTGTFVEVVVAPSFTAEALEIMKAKENMRVLRLPGPVAQPEIRSIDGGVLVQRTEPYREDWRVVSEREPTAHEMRAMQLAWKVCRHTKSNAIIFADEDAVIGIGAGQMNRVESAEIAVRKSRRPLAGSAVASDAFLPFPDTMEVAAAAGATALVQPGGSIRDQEVIEAANRLNIAMIFTGVRHFRH